MPARPGSSLNWRRWCRRAVRAAGPNSIGRARYPYPARLIGEDDALHLADTRTRAASSELPSSGCRSAISGQLRFCTRSVTRARTIASDCSSRRRVLGQHVDLAIDRKRRVTLDAIPCPPGHCPEQQRRTEDRSANRSARNEARALRIISAAGPCHGKIVVIPGINMPLQRRPQAPGCPDFIFCQLAGRSHNHNASGPLRAGCSRQPGASCHGPDLRTAGADICPHLRSLGRIPASGRA